MIVPDVPASQTLAVALAHRSIRRFKPDPIPEDILEQILMGGLRSSSSGNLQLWSVIVTREKGLREQLFELHHRQEMIRQAPVVFTFCSDLHRTIRWLELRRAAVSFDDFLGYVKGVVDAVIGAQTMALCAESLGLGFCYMGTTLYAVKGIGELLQVPKYVVPVTSFVLGYPDEAPAPRERLPLQAVAHRETYQMPSDEAILAFYRVKEESFLARYKEDKQAGDLPGAAHFYTSKNKYSKELHIRGSQAILERLKAAGLWNF